MEVIRIGEHRLREVENQDLEQVLRWRNAEHIRRISHKNHLITNREHKTWFRKIKESKTTQCLIFEDNDLPRGIVNISNIDSINRTCSWSIYIGGENPPNGLGSVMGYLALEYIFKILGMKIVRAESFSNNIRSIEYHKKLGFIEKIVHLRQHLRGGVDIHVISMMNDRDRWNERKRILEKRYFN